MLTLCSIITSMVNDIKLDKITKNGITGDQPRE